MTKKDYVVSLNVSFTTPLDAEAESEIDAENKCKSQFKKLFKEFDKKLNEWYGFEQKKDGGRMISCPYCGYDGSDRKIGFEMPYIEHGVQKLRCLKCKRVFNVEIKKRVAEGYLYCSPYVGDHWFLAPEIRLIEKHGDLELPKEEIGDIGVDELFDRLEKKKVRITVEEIE